MSTRFTSTPAAIVGAVLIAVAASTLSASAIGADETDPAKAAEESPTLKRIFANWKARADRVKSFHFTWDSRVGIPKGAPDRFSRHRNPAAEPPELLRQVKYSLRQSEFWAEGNDHFREEYFMVSVHRDRSSDVKSRYHITFDGKNYLCLILQGDSGRRPMGFIKNLQPSDFVELNPLNPLNPKPRRTPSDGLEPEGRFHDIDDPFHRPLLLAFRAFEPVLHWGPDRCRVAQELASSRWVKLERQDEEGRVVECCWVDPSRDDVVVAAEIWGTVPRRKLGLSFSIEYQRDKTFGWVPSGWSIDAVGRRGRTDELTECTVTKYTFNEHFPPETFLLKFPPGTELWDRSQREFFVRKDGSRRLIPRGNKHPTYEQLLKEDDTVPPAAK